MVAPKSSKPATPTRAGGGRHPTLDDRFPLLPITPELKAAALEGMPLFQPANNGDLTPEEIANLQEAMRNPERVLPPGATPLDVWNSLSFAERRRITRSSRALPKPTSWRARPPPRSCAACSTSSASGCSTSTKTCRPWPWTLPRKSPRSSTACTPRSRTSPRRRTSTPSRHCSRSSPRR